MNAENGRPKQLIREQQRKSQQLTEVGRPMSGGSTTTLAGQKRRRGNDDSYQNTDINSDFSNKSTVYEATASAPVNIAVIK
jgi:hypothetical protein